MSKQLQITGTIHHIGETKDVGKAKPYLKRTFALSDPDAKEEWPNWFVFELGGTKVDDINAHKVGDVVTVSFNLKGRQWQDKWFANVEAWKIEAVAGASTPDSPPADTGAESEDIPF